MPVCLREGPVILGVAVGLPEVGLGEGRQVVGAVLGAARHHGGRGRNQLGRFQEENLCWRGEQEGV